MKRRQQPLLEFGCPRFGEHLIEGDHVTFRVTVPVKLHAAGIWPLVKLPCHDDPKPRRRKGNRVQIDVLHQGGPQGGLLGGPPPGPGGLGSSPFSLPSAVIRAMSTPSHRQMHRGRS